MRWMVGLAMLLVAILVVASSPGEAEETGTLNLRMISVAYSTSSGDPVDSVAVGSMQYVRINYEYTNGYNRGYEIQFEIGDLRSGLISGSTHDHIVVGPVFVNSPAMEFSVELISKSLPVGDEPAEADLSDNMLEGHLTAIEPPISFRFPVTGRPFVDWTITNYMEVGGPRMIYLMDPWHWDLTYEGSRGTDFLIGTHSEIDLGVPVLASAEGTVLSVHDQGSGDCASDPNGITIAHGDGWTSRYVNLKTGSITVQQGDPVEKGDRLGDVAGCLDGPFLHFEVEYLGKPIAQFASSSTTPAMESKFTSWSIWDEEFPHVYSLPPRVIDSEVVREANLDSRDSFLWQEMYETFSPDNQTALGVIISPNPTDGGTYEFHARSDDGRHLGSEVYEFQRWNYLRDQPILLATHVWPNSDLGPGEWVFSLNVNGETLQVGNLTVEGAIPVLRADAGIDKTILINESVALDAGQSEGIHDVEWCHWDGYRMSQNGCSTNYTGFVSGGHSIQLTIQDRFGRTSYDMINITVIDPNATTGDSSDHKESKEGLLPYLPIIVPLAIIGIGVIILRRD